MTNRDVPVPAAKAKSILFGHFGHGCLIRRVGAGAPTVIRFRESYMAGLQVGWLAFERLDSVQADAAALRALQQSAT
jgi:HK97 family phage major capsid protein